GYATQQDEYAGKSFAIEHSFYGMVNSSINFYRGGGAMGGYITFHVNDNAESVRITNYGNMGIGTASPKWKLDVNGPLAVKGQAFGDANGSEIFIGDIASSDGARQLGFYANNQRSMLLDL